MKIMVWLLSPLIGLISACSVNQHTSDAGQNINREARFEWFDYEGRDDIFKKPLSADEYQNPILAGYHPDPSVVRVGKDYYLINSTFGFFPGIPIFHSTDLVNWVQIGNAVNDSKAFNYDGLHLGYQGVYAPAIEYKDGVFYIINTCIGCGGNFVVTAKNPAGPWSDPIWMPHLVGIDPSIFFDNDGKTYVVHHRDPDLDKKRYPAHTALWIMEVDPVTFEPRSDDIMLIDGGDETPWNTDYHEGPHLYFVDGSYYLSAPGGGTGYFHQQLIYRSSHIYGPYEANPNNPILTQWGLPDDREHPVTATGHADMFEDTHGDWWAVFLGTRVYDLTAVPQDPGNFHTGRETFMLPVTWKDGWPTILEKDTALPYRVKRPQLPRAKTVERATTGNFTIREDFTESKLGPHWLFIRTPHTQWWRSGGGALHIQPRAEGIGQYQQPSFVGRRLAHLSASFSTKLVFSPQAVGDEAGLLAIQNDEHFYTLGLGHDESGDTVVRVRRRAGADTPVAGVILKEQKITLPLGDPVYFQMNVNKGVLDLLYSTTGKDYKLLLENADANVLSTAMAGGFTGAVVGMYALGGGEPD